MSRFWAWNTYVPFALAVSLVFCGHCDGGWVLIVLLLSLVPAHLLLNRLESQLLSATGVPPRNFPHGNLLQFTIWACLTGMFYLLIVEFRSNATLTDQVGGFFANMIAPWFFGAFASRIPFVLSCSLPAAVIYVICVTPVKPSTARLAKAALLVLLLMSLFTVWVTSSELSTGRQVAEFAAETVLKKLLGLPIDLAVSVLWVVGTIWAFAAIDGERAAYSAAHRFAPDVPPLWIKLACPALAWACLFGANLLLVYRA